MVRITRVSKAPGTLQVHINLPQPDGGVAVETLLAEPATAAGPQFATIVSPEVAARLQADAGLAAHFSFEVIEDGGRRRPKPEPTP